MRLEGLPLSGVQQDFLAYWNRQAGSRFAPLRRDIDVLHVPLLMPHAIFFDVQRDPLDFKYRLFGTAIRNMTIRDFTGMKMSEIEGRGPGSQIWTFLDEARAGREPVFHSVPYIGPKKDFVNLNNLFLPVLGDDGGETVMIIVVSHFTSK